MLVFTRRVSEEFLIGSDERTGPPDLFDRNGKRVQISVTLLGVKGNQVRFGISCPKSVTVDRTEINERRAREYLQGNS